MLSSGCGGTSTPTQSTTTATLNDEDVESHTAADNPSFDEEGVEGENGTNENDDC